VVEAIDLGQSMLRTAAAMACRMREHVNIMSLSSAQEARERLGIRLREMRQEARLSGRRFAALAGWADATNVTKVEKAQRGITAEHILLWCRICEAPPERKTELLEAQRAVARMWISIRDHKGYSLNARQQATVGDLFSRVSSALTYQTKVFPGLLQSEAYMTEVLRGVRRDRQLLSDDVAKAVATRMARQDNLRRTGARFWFLLEETVLRYRYTPADVHRQQLMRLKEAARLPAVYAVAIIPDSIDRRGIRARESFEIYGFPEEESTVQVETLGGLLTLTHPDDVAMYQRVWDELMTLR
jgi:transcriptional regulator with XRE-family HTH domain